jgi:hypothetical protein
MNKSILMVPTTYLGDPPYAVAVIVLGNMWVGSTDISSSICFRSTFKAEPLFTNTLPTVQSWHLTIMYTGFVVTSDIELIFGEV